MALGRVRFLFPNAITSIGIAFGALSVQATASGHYRSAAWWVMYSALADKLDGMVARKLNASSAFGGQLDSFADFLSFGVAPATLFFAFFRNHPELGWAGDLTGPLLALISFAWIVAEAARLARFNLTPSSEHYFFGFPTTFAGGFAAAAFVTLLKYGDPTWSSGDPMGADTFLLGAATRLDGAMRLVPIFMLLGAFTMVSAWRVPKIQRTKNLLLDGGQLVNILLGYVTCMFHVVPEYIAIACALFVLVAAYYHLTSDRARGAKLPPMFPE